MSDVELKFEKHDYDVGVNISDYDPASEIFERLAKERAESIDKLLRNAIADGSTFDIEPRKKLTKSGLLLFLIKLRLHEYKTRLYYAWEALKGNYPSDLFDDY